MGWRAARGWVAAFLVSLPVIAPAAAPYQPPAHSASPPSVGATPQDLVALADGGLDLEHGRTAQWLLAEHRRLETTLATVPPQRKGVVDVYVLSVALDSDPVFGREAREAGKVLSHRYGAVGRTITLAGSDGNAESRLPSASPSNIAAVLARMAEVMDVKEDVLVLYTTSHGAPLGIVYNDADNGFGAISPFRLWRMLDTLGFQRRMVIISACFSGVFVPLLSNDDGVIVTAADSQHTSFGCQADNDWTFFGDAMINHALRKHQPLASAAAEAKSLIVDWEAKGGLDPSNPQVKIGSRAGLWLDALDQHVPMAATVPVGRPAVRLLDKPSIP